MTMCPLLVFRRVVSQVSSDLQIDDFVISAKKVLAGQETETTRKMLHFLAIAAVWSTLFCHVMDTLSPFLILLDDK